MTWTPATPSSSTWVSEPGPASAWSRAPASFSNWSVEAGHTRRITQDGRLRVTEQSVIRIIEHFDTAWNLDPKAYATWSTS